MISLIKLSENEKRLIIVILLLVIVAFVIIGLISLIVQKIMQFQAKKADDMLSDVYRTRVITTERKLRLYGIKKNWMLFFKQAIIPFIILAVAWIGFICYGIFSTPVNETVDFSKIDVWSYGTIANPGETATGGTGFLTLFFVHDWANAEKISFWGLKVYGGFPPLLNKPHWSWDAWFSYLFVPANAVGIVWLVICVQAYIARSYRIFKISLTIFKKTLDNPMSKQQVNAINNNLFNR